MQKYRCSFGLMINLNFDRISLDSRDIMPKLHFHVRSIDNYQRFCSEGYGSTYLPDISGHDSKTVSLWTIMPSNDTGRMRRFFLGNAPELACPAFDGNLTNSIVNKYGQNTEPSGYLVLQFEMIWERCQERALSRYSSATGRKSSGLFQQVYDNYAHNQII